MKKSKAYLKLVAFPTIIIYLELILNIFSGLSLNGIPFILVFSISAGALFTVLCSLFGAKRFNLLIKIWTFLLAVLYGAEYVVHTIFSQFYGLSILATAAGNHLETFIGTTMQAVVKCLPGIILMLLPFVLSLIFAVDRSGKHGKVKKKRIKNSGVIIISLALAILFYIAGLVLVNLPSTADITPKSLYYSDTALNDKLEQFGLLTMLRIDAKYMIVEPEESSEYIEEEPVEVRPAPEPEIDYGENAMNFDFESMLSNTSSKDIQWLTKYFSAKTPTNKNKYTGTMEGYNVIFLTLEGMSGYGISQELTPTLYKLTHECFVFSNFYTALHFTSTSNGECQNLLGLYPKNGQPTTMTRTGVLGTNCYFSLAQQLGRLGYTNLAYHNNQYDLYGRFKSHNNLGYHYVYGAKGTEGRFVVDGGSWPQKDSYMIDQTVKKYASSDTPFNIYYITISGHTPYGWNYANEDFKDILNEKTNYSDQTKAYLGTCMEVDRALEHLINLLDEYGKLDNTLIVASPDHIPYGSVEILEELAGKDFGTSEALTAINESAIDFDVYKSCLIMWNSKLAQEEPVYVNKPCCQVDILPTISNLLGLEYDSRMLSGSDLLSDSEGLVVFSSKCWRSGRGFYNRFTQTFTPLPGEFGSQKEIDDYVSSMKTVVANKLDCTAKIVESNFYDYAVKYLEE